MRGKARKAKGKRAIKAGDLAAKKGKRVKGGSVSVGSLGYSVHIPMGVPVPPPPKKG